MRGLPRAALAWAIVLFASLGAVAQASYAAQHERTLERLVATPTPLGPAAFASDQASWRVDVPEGVIVLVEARGPASSPFYLRAHPLAAPEPAVALPGTAQAVFLTTPGPWRVVVDPAGGALVHVQVVFRGHVGDVGGSGASFELTDLARDNACVVPGVCLP